MNIQGHKNCYESGIYEQALDKGSFVPLLNYPCLLFSWQQCHPQDVLRIAKISAHRLGHHVTCRDDCEKIEQFLNKSFGIKQPA